MSLNLDNKSWLTAAEATARLNARYPGRSKPIDDGYVRDLTRQGRIHKRAFDGRTNLYLESDVESVVIREGPGRHPGVPARPAR